MKWSKMDKKINKKNSVKFNFENLPFFRYLAKTDVSGSTTESIIFFGVSSHSVWRRFISRINIKTLTINFNFQCSIPLEKYFIS